MGGELEGLVVNGSSRPGTQGSWLPSPHSNFSVGFQGSWWVVT